MNTGVLFPDIVSLCPGRQFFALTSRIMRILEVMPRGRVGEDSSSLRCLLNQSRGWGALVKLQMVENDMKVVT